MAHLSEFERSYSHVLLYPPQPAAMVNPAGRETNFSTKMYGRYLQEKRQAGTPIAQCFLAWHRGKEYDAEANDLVYRGGKNQQRTVPTPRRGVPLLV